jgi:hypothetical protein
MLNKRTRVGNGIKLVCLVVFASVATTRLFAEIMTGATPEWMAHKAALIFVGVPQKTEVKHLLGDRWVTRVQFRIDQRIKGPLSGGDLVTVFSLDWTGRTDQMHLAGAVEKKRSVLVFAVVAEHSFPEADGRYEFLPHFLDRHSFFADELPKCIYAQTGAAIRGYDVLLKRVQEQVAKQAGLMARGWRGKIIERLIDAGDETDAFKELYSLSSVDLRSIEYKEP